MGKIAPVEVLALVDGLDFLTFTQEGDCDVFVAYNLMRESNGSWGRVFYDHCKLLGEDSNYIQVQLHLSRTFPGHLPSVPNQRDNVLNLDDEDLDGDMEVPPAAGVDGDNPEADDGGGEVLVLKQPPQTIHIEKQHITHSPIAEGFQVLTSPAVSLGTIF